MDNLALFLRAFISKKLSTDPGWQGIHVILSDGSVPPALTMAMLHLLRAHVSMAPPWRWLC